jgi:hypothetical protein
VTNERREERKKKIYRERERAKLSKNRGKLLSDDKNAFHLSTGTMYKFQKLYFKN